MEFIDYLVDDYENLNLIEIDNKSTRELLSDLRLINKFESKVEYKYIDRVENVKAKIKATLKFREHIPNKLEAKAIRQEKAKANRGSKNNKNK